MKNKITPKLFCYFFSPLLFSSFLLLIQSCETPVPADMMFCKSEEVYVLEKPFDEKSAIIVMYKGDDLRLLGDTVYQPAIEPNARVDSSRYFVKVRAKRGVIGWVNAVDLQHERPKIPTWKPKEAIVVEKIEATTPTPAIDSSLLGLDSSLVMTDSLWGLWMGSYSLLVNPEQPAAQQEAIRVLCTQKDSVRMQFQFTRSQADSCNTEFKGIAFFTFNQAVFKKDSCAYLFRFETPFLKIKQRGNCPESKAGCNFEFKLKKLTPKSK